MKKIFLSIALLLIITNTSFSQPVYTDTTKYLPLTGGTIIGTPGPELVAIDATCTGWTFTGTGYACGTDGTVTKLLDGIGTAYFTQAMEVGATYRVVVVTSGGTWAGIPSTRPFLVYLGASAAEFISSDTTTTFYRTALTAGSLTLTTEANGGTSAPRARFTVSVKKMAGAGLIVQGPTTFNGPVQIDGTFTLPGDFQFRADPYNLSFYFGRGIGPSMTGTAVGNAVIGTYAGLNLTTGGDNVLFGANSGSALTAGQYSTAVGVDSLMRATTASGNTAFGKTAVWGLTGAANVGVGVNALYSPAGTGTGTQNAAVGNNSGFAITSGSNDVFVGYYAGAALTSGSSNVIIGKDAGYITGAAPAVGNALVTQHGNTFIGFRAGLGSATQRSNAAAIGFESYVDADNTVALGDENVTDVRAGSAAQATVSAKSITFTATLFAALGTPANGTLAYCSDCLVLATCAGAGTGALAKRLNGVWVCN